MNNGQYRSIVQPYLSLPNNSDEYTQKLYASLSEIKEILNTDEIQMIFVAHRYEQIGRIPWDIMSKKEKFLFLLNIIIRILAFILSLYIFIVTLDLMTSAFTLLSRSAFGQIFKSRIFLKNPIISLMIGIIITTILQSSSTVTSIIVSMVGSGIVTDIRSVIPMIMGTSITNTLVAFSQIGNRNEFSRSFSSGVLMDVFNYLTTLILLPMEILIDRITPSSDIFHRGGYLARVSGAIAITISEKERINIQLLKSLTKPLTKLIIQIDENVLLSNETNQTIGKIYCTPHLIKCKYLFRSMIEKFNDYTVGIILFICSLIILTGILLLMVKLLKSLIIGVIDDTLKQILHIQSYGWKEYLLGYVFIIIGIFGAVLVQSSSVFCSILTPLVGLQVLSLERNYELTIGANIGTTITAFLASLTQTGLFFRQSIQIALIHFLFNLSGCILWYIFPYFRRIPIYLSYQIGHIVSKYRWFALLYLIINFFLFPLIILFLALIHWLVAILFLLCLFLLIIFILIINYFQKANPNKLPSILQSWSFLPRSLRSFSYWDHRLEIFLRFICCQRYFKLIYPSENTDKPLKEQYVSMKDQYLLALDHRYLVHTHQLNQLFEKHYAPMITNYVQEFYRSLTGKPTQGQRALSNLIQMNSTNIHHEEEEELIDRIVLFDRDKKKEILVNEQKSSLSF
ncbi:unnamed protein product [Adineta steineri]|uniref:Sodium-dependent phosphate transporter n=1 Tax=Adineta steineri TaxID=433720 RepID=A0A819PE26_9BILA|nr:unnamed protein product [Adineta steineri]